VGGGVVSPKGKGGDRGPASIVTIACLEYRFMDGAMLSFDDAICL